MARDRICVKYTIRITYTYIYMYIYIYHRGGPSQIQTIQTISTYQQRWPNDNNKKTTKIDVGNQFANLLILGSR